MIQACRKDSGILLSSVPLIGLLFLAKCRIDGRRPYGERVMVVEDDGVNDNIKKCEGLVVGCFFGRRLPFMLVNRSVKKAWN